jgi:hypothetical protein
VHLVGFIIRIYHDVRSPERQNEETLHQRNTDVCHTILTDPELLKVCDSPWLDVSISALILVEDILNICCELWLDKQQ